MQRPIVRLVCVALAVVSLRWTTCAEPPRRGYPTEENGATGHQDWGHVRVRAGAHMFWWLHFTTDAAAAERPLAIWLQGGPGASSTGYGNFEEIGPRTANGSRRAHTWVRHMHVLFVDAPIGAGFSWAETTEAFSRTDAECAGDLVQLMHGFYAARPEFRGVDVHLFGESYGGKLAMVLAGEWRKATSTPNPLPAPIVSVTSIDGWISPITSMLAWAPFLLNTGFVEPAGHARIAAAAEQASALIAADRWLDATQQWGRTEWLIQDETDGVDFYNVLYPRKYRHGQICAASKNAGSKSSDWTMVNTVGGRRPRNVTDTDADMYAILVKRDRRLFAGSSWRTVRDTAAHPNEADAKVYAVDDADDADDAADDADARLSRLMNGPVRQALNISAHIVWGGQERKAFANMRTAFMRPAVERVEQLLNETGSALRVHIVSGQLDLIVATPGTVEWVRQLRWPGAADFEKQPRCLLVTAETEASAGAMVQGYARRFGALAYYAVERAGHMVPLDNVAGMEAILRSVTGLAWD